jgi:hypothetical protein
MKKLFAVTFICIVWTFSACLHADMITLKDEQVFEADVVDFDEYYLNVRLIKHGITETAKPEEKGKDIVSIPWNEVAKIKHTTTGASWLEETHLSSIDTEVSTLVVPLSQDTAFSKSIFPGFLIHGAGNFYAKDRNTGMSLLSSEIAGLVLMAISGMQLLQPYDSSQNYSITYSMGGAGLGLFIGSWLWDMIFCRGTVEQYNNEHKFLINEGKNENSSGK